MGNSRAHWAFHELEYLTNNSVRTPKLSPNTMYPTKRSALTILIPGGLILGLCGIVSAQNPIQVARAKQAHEQASAFYEAGRYNEATALEEQVLQVFERELGAAHLEVAASLNNLGVMYQAKGDYSRAERAFARALEIKKQHWPANHPEIALSKNNIGELYRAAGKYDLARSFMEDARAIYLGLRSNQYEAYRLAEVLNNLGLLYRGIGNFAVAEQSYRQALSIYERLYGPNHADVALVLNNLSELFSLERDCTRAEDAGLRALRTFINVYGKNHPDVALTLGNLAELYRRKKDFPRAEQYFREALLVSQAVGLSDQHPYVIALQNNVALLLDEKGTYANAETLFLKTLALKKETYGARHPSVAITLLNLASLYQATGNYKQAVTYAEQAAENRESTLTLILTTGSETQKQLFLNTLSADNDSIVSLHIQTASKNRSAPETAQAARLALTTILRRKGRALDAMTNQIARLRRRASSQDQALLDQLAAARSYLATLQISGGGQWSPADRRREIDRTAAEVERLEAAVSSRSAEFRVETQPVSLEAVRQAMPVDASLVEIFLYHPVNPKPQSNADRFGGARYVAYVLRHNTLTPEFIDLGEAAAIDATVVRLRAALQDRSRVDFSTLARTVDKSVMEPIRKLLGSSQRIFLSPDGALNLIPFAALVDENGKYLAERYSLTYLTSGRDLLRSQVSVESRSTPVIMANPLFDLATATRSRPANPQDGQPQNNERNLSPDLALLTYKPLPGTSEEASSLSKMLSNALVLTQDQATERALKQLHSPRILHVATHGFFLPDPTPQLDSAAMSPCAAVNEHSSPTVRLPSPSNPKSRSTSDVGDSSIVWGDPLLRSGLILAGVRQRQSGAGEDGVLTALETAGLDLSGTKLVVLSACETGLGDVRNGEGVYGLRRALVLAGSETQVMSLWKVSDAGTRDLMIAYYLRLQAGEGRTEALRQVQLGMLRGQIQPATINSVKRQTSDTDENTAAKDYRHPYYWAAFIPSGDWRNMDGK